LNLEMALNKSRAAAHRPSSWPAWLAPRVHGLQRLIRKLPFMAGRGPAVPPPTSAQDTVSRLLPIEDAAVREVRDALAGLLDQHPMARNVLPALARVERRIGKVGAKGVEGLPGKVLLDACAQLDRLLDDRSTPLLWALRDNLQQALRACDPQLHAAAAAPRAALQVEEASLTAFMDASQDWDRQLRARPAL
jgi:hypothetical protein